MRVKKALAVFFCGRENFIIIYLYVILILFMIINPLRVCSVKILKYL